MSIHASPTIKLSPTRDSYDQKKRTPNKYDAPFDSPGNSPVSLEHEPHSGSSPIKNVNLSPLLTKQNDSIHSANPMGMFPSSPIGKVVVTEAIKIGSAKKSKDPLLFSPDRSTSLHENLKGGLQGSPSRVLMDSPRKENVARSPHEITSDLYITPSESFETKRDGESYMDDYQKKPLFETSAFYNREMYVPKFPETTGAKGQFQALTYFDPDDLLKQDGIKRGSQNFGQQPQKGNTQGNIIENESFGRNLDYVEEPIRQENPKRSAQMFSDQPERGPRDSRETRDTRDFRDPRDTRETRDNRDYRDNRDNRDNRDSRDNRDNRDDRDNRDFRDPRDTRETRDTRDTRNTKDNRETRETRETRDTRDTREGGGSIRNRLPSHSPEIKISRPEEEDDVAEEEGSFGQPKKSPVTSLAEFDNSKPEPKERSKTKKSVVPASSQKNESETGADIRGDVQEKKYFTAAKPPRSIDMSPNPKQRELSATKEEKTMSTGSLRKPPPIQDTAGSFGNQGASAARGSNNRSDIWTPRSVEGSRRMNYSKNSGRSELDLDERVAASIHSYTVLPDRDFFSKADHLKDPSEQIIKALRKGRDKFRDIVFLPSITSLVNSVKNNKRPEWKSLEWWRIPDLLRPNKITLYDAVSPLNIKPGALQNHEFLSVMAALSEYPDIVKSLIANQTYNIEGCYSVKVCRDGVWRYILIDDWLPCVKEGNKGQYRTAFSQTVISDKKVDIWHILYEKAWAKLFGTYQILESTSLEQMLRDSTGAPVETYACKDMETVWNILTEASTQGYIIVASIDSEQAKISPEEIYTRGLNPLYANTILDISLSSSSENRIIKLRNIWNEQHTWKSQQATNEEADEEKKMINMTLKEFFLIFTHIHICQYNERLVYKSITNRHVHQAYSITKFTCNTPMKTTFELIQNDLRLYRGDPTYTYSNSRFLVFRVTNSRPYYIKGGFSTSKYNTLRINLEEGDYYIVGIVDWKDKVYDFTLSAYSDAEINFERIHYSDNPDIISELLKAYMEDQSIPRSLSKSGNKEIVKYEKSVEDLKLKIELYMNNSTTKQVNIRKKLTKMENTNLLNVSPSEESDEVEFKLWPQISKVVITGTNDVSRPSNYVSEDIVSE